jgi:pimeloyl-ACP methyl ester carboxylesterase
MNTETPTNTPRKGRRIWRWIRRGLLGLVALVVVACIVSSIYQAIASAREASRFPAPGRMVDVGGHRLHLNCTGQGGPTIVPTIVLDAGLGEASLSWSKVQPEAAKFARVCSYDRAGYAWSEAGPGPRTSAQIVKELHTLLVNAGEPKPYVLAGHSFGGYNVRLFAAQYPDETAGLVLVDSSHEDQFERFPPSFRSTRSAELLLQAMPWLARLGVLRLLNQPIGNVKDYAPGAQPLARGIGFQSNAYDGALKEFTSLMESAAEVRAVKMPGGKLLLGDKPLTVLSQGDVSKLPQRFPPLELAEFMKVWHELQADLATRSSHGKLIIAEKSSHYVLLDEPQLVIDALRRACESSNKPTALASTKP